MAKHRRRNKKRWKKAPIARNKEEKCVTKYCRNRRIEGKTSHTLANGKSKTYVGFKSHCHKCRSRILKTTQPVTYVLNMLRASARKRKLPFTITKDQFAGFCAKTRYLELRGQEPDSLTIDRVESNEGYHIWNLRVLTHEENSEQGVDNESREDRGCAQVDAPF